MKLTSKTALIIFSGILLLLVVVTILGIFLSKEDDILLQGQIEATEISISGTLPGRIEKYYVEEGQHVEKGDTLVSISSPQAIAKYEQAKAIERASLAQNEKVDAGTRSQLINIAKEIWSKAKADLNLAKITYENANRIFNI